MNFQAPETLLRVHICCQCQDTAPRESMSIISKMVNVMWHLQDLRWECSSYFMHLTSSDKRLKLFDSSFITSSLRLRKVLLHFYAPGRLHSVVGICCECYDTADGTIHHNQVPRGNVLQTVSGPKFKFMDMAGSKSAHTQLLLSN